MKPVNVVFNPRPFYSQYGDNGGIDQVVRIELSDGKPKTIENDNDEESWEDDEEEVKGYMKSVQEIQKATSNFLNKHKSIIKYVIMAVCIIAYFIYFTFALLHHFGDEGRLGWYEIIF